MIHFPPVLEKQSLFPFFLNSQLFSLDLSVFCITLAFISSPYFDHDAFMHHTLHVLDAHGPLHTSPELHNLADPMDLVCKIGEKFRTNERVRMGSQHYVLPRGKLLAAGVTIEFLNVTVSDR